MSLVTRIPVFGSLRAGKTQTACSATEASWSLETLNIARIYIGIILSKQRRAKSLIRLRGCAG